MDAASSFFLIYKSAHCIAVVMHEMFMLPLAALKEARNPATSSLLDLLFMCNASSRYRTPCILLCLHAVLSQSLCLSVSVVDSAVHLQDTFGCVSSR